MADDAQLGGDDGLEFVSYRIQRLARELADLTGDSMTDAVEGAIRGAIARRREAIDVKRMRLGRIAAHCAALPVLDGSTSDVLRGYDDAGRPR